MHRKKVLHVLHAFSHGGLENGLVNIINGSPPDLEHELCLLTQSGEFIRRLKNPVRYYELHKKAGNSAKTILQLRKVIRDSGADIVHTRNWGAFDGVIAACLCPGVKLLHGEHGRDMSDPQGTNRRRNLIRRLFSPWIQKFTTVSGDLACWLRTEVGIPNDKVVLIPNGVDTEHYHPIRDSELRRAFGIAPDEFVIGTIGRLDPVKNHAGLLEAYAALTGKARMIRLVIVGDGPEKRNIQALIERLKLTPTPILTGYRNDIERFYGVFDIFVLNSFAEGMSNTLLEAMSSGLPIICTPVGGNVDLIEDGIRGRFVPVDNKELLADAINEYRISTELRESVGVAARHFVQTSHSLSQMTRRYGELYITS